MPADQPAHPTEVLAELLETLSPADRMRVTAWLLRLRAARPEPLPSGLVARTFAAGALPPWPVPAPGAEHRVGRLAAALPAGEDSQLITIRLPTDRHSELRAWCADHRFSMAAVVRGLIERFLEEQRPAQAS